MMETRLNIEENKGTVTAYEDGTAVGDLTFKIRSEGIIVITHTLAFEGNEGKGIGATLMEAAVRYALENDKKIVPNIGNPFVMGLFAYLFTDLLRVVSYAMLYDIVLDLFPLAIALVIYYFSGFLVDRRRESFPLVGVGKRRSR